jgi:site-specific recombinase XerD
MNRKTCKNLKNSNMKSSQKFNLLLWVNKQKEKNGEFPIYIRIYVDGVRKEIATKHFIKLIHWDDKKQRVKSIAPNSQLLNTVLDKDKLNLQHLFLESVSKGDKITPQMLKDKFLGIDNLPKEKTILEAFDYHALKMAELVKIGKVSNATLTRYKITKNKVEAFIKAQYRTDDKDLPEIRLRFVSEFEHFLLTVQTMQSNTAHKYIKNLKTVMNMAVGLDWIPSNPFNLFKCSYTAPERDILNHEELYTLQHKVIENERLAEVRDVFVFCCYTGFAYSDIFQFEKNAVMRGLDNELWLSTNRQKTGTKESVPLLPVAIEIIEKYENNPYCIKFNKLLPVNSNQKYNAYLSEIAAICNIKKHLTSHIARHTFATTVTLANGVPIETVSSMLGHTSIRTTQIYAKVVEKKVSEDMKLLRAKLFGSPQLQVEKKIG